jgi:hypothetical protein
MSGTCCRKGGVTFEVLFTGDSMMGASWVAVNVWFGWAMYMLALWFVPANGDFDLLNPDAKFWFLE